MERIIGNLEKVKLKLDEAFFYLDEIEELVEEDGLDQEEGGRVAAAGDRLREELGNLTTKVAELQNILEMLGEDETGEDVVDGTVEEV